MRVPPWRRNSALRRRRRHVPLGRRLGPGVRARLGLGRPRARRPGRGDDPAGRGRPADRGPDRRPGGPAGRRCPRQGRASLVRQGGQAVGLAGAGRGRRRRGPLAGPQRVADDDHGHDRRRRPISTGGDRPRPDRRAVRLRADDRHGPALRPEPRRAGDRHDRPPSDDAGSGRSTTPVGSNTPPRRPSRSRASSATRTPVGPSPG